MILVYLAGSPVGSQSASVWHLVQVIGWRGLVDALVGWRHLVNPLRCERPLLKGVAVWRRGRGWRLSVKHWTNKQFEAVAGGDALAAVERAEPPSLQTASVLLNDGQDISLPKRKLLWRLRDIVI